MCFLWEQSWKVLEGTVELAEMYSKAVHSYLLKNVSPWCGKPFSWLVPYLCTSQWQDCLPAPRKEKSALPSVRDRGRAISVAKPPGAENLVPAVGHRIRLDALPCLSCHLNNHSVSKDFLPGTHPGFLPRPLLVWMSVSVFCLPADHTQQETDEAPGRMLASACWQL